MELSVGGAPKALLEYPPGNAWFKKLVTSGFLIILHFTQ
jgi:hypothetical protein